LDLPALEGRCRAEVCDGSISTFVADRRSNPAPVSSLAPCCRAGQGERGCAGRAGLCRTGADRAFVGRENRRRRLSTLFAPLSPLGGRRDRAAQRSGAGGDGRSGLHDPSTARHLENCRRAQAGPVDQGCHVGTGTQASVHHPARLPLAARMPGPRAPGQSDPVTACRTGLSPRWTRSTPRPRSVA